MQHTVKKEMPAPALQILIPTAATSKQHCHRCYTTNIVTLCIKIQQTAGKWSLWLLKLSLYI